MSEERIVFENNVRRLIAESKDMYYAQFLTQLLYRFRQDQVTKEYVMEEINRTYPQYLQRIGQGMSEGQAVPKEKKNMEFAVGAWVFGVIGALFVLIAFVMLGVTYMNSFVKGMILYMIAAVVLLASELAVAKKMPRFSYVLTGLGISGLFLTTMINVAYLENFGPLIGGIVCAGIFVLTLFLGKRKETNILHFFNFLGCYLCVFPIWEAVSGEWNEPVFQRTESLIGPVTIYFIAIVAVIFFINLLSTVMYGKKNQSVIHILHQCANTVLTIAFSFVGLDSGIELFIVLIFIATALLMQGINLKLNIRSREKKGIKVESTGANITYIVNCVLLLAFFVLMCLFSEYDIRLHIAVGVLAAVETVLFVLFRRNWLKWVSYESACFTVLAVYGLMAGREKYSYDVAIGATIVIFLVTKILARCKKIYTGDMVITLVMTGWTLFSFGQADLMYALILFGTFLIGLFVEKNWKSLYEELLVLLVCGFVLLNFMNELTPVILVCVFMTGFFGFNSVSFFWDKYTKVYNYINLGILGVLYVVAPFVVSDIAMFILIVLGCGFLLFAFTEKYGMDFRIKSILFVLFLCYMVIVWKLPLRVFKSILLMVVAVAAVVAGFIRRERKLRITGLVLSLAVCGKLILYDFPGAATLEKIILFLVSGAIVLAISGVYIALEKKMM